MVLRLRDIITFLCGIIVIAAVIVTAFILLKNGEKPVIGMISSSRPVVIIDAGHGGVDGGAVSLTGVHEKDINLQIAKKAELLFGLYGINTVMTRSEDISIHSPESDTIREKKVSDLKNRVALINSYPDGLLLSIHQNTFTDNKYYGAQVFFHPDDNSKALAMITQDYMRQALGQQGINRKAAKIPSGVYLMKNVKITAVLVECGFLTNPSEESLLRDNDYQWKITKAMVASYINYLNSEETVENVS